MSSLYELYATDQDLETSGFWHPITAECAFLLARAGGANTKFSRSLETKTRPHRRQIEEDKMDLDLANQLMIESFAESVVLDWKGVSGPDGKDIKFSRAHAVKLLTELPDLFGELRDAAAKQSNFRAKEVAGDVKN